MKCRDLPDIFRLEDPTALAVLFPRFPPPPPPPPPPGRCEEVVGPSSLREEDLPREQNLGRLGLTRAGRPPAPEEALPAVAGAIVTIVWGISMADSRGKNRNGMNFMEEMEEMEYAVLSSARVQGKDE